MASNIENVLRQIEACSAELTKAEKRIPALAGPAADSSVEELLRQGRALQVQLLSVK